MSTYNQYLEEREFSGSVLISKHDDVVFSGGFGKASIELSIPNSIHSKYRIGSITKTFTAVTILQLIETGLISLDDRVNKFFPKQRDGSHINIGNLLSHTSGIYNYTNNPSMKEWAGKSVTPDEISQRFCNVELTHLPNTTFSYSNSNYVLLGMLIEKLTDKVYDQVLKENIFDPFEMSDTEIEVPFKTVENLSTGYELDHSQSLIISPFFNTTNAFAAGNIISTAIDLQKWDRALNSDHLLSPQIKKMMYNPYLHNSQYGFGWFLQDTPFGKLALHSGGITGYCSMLLRFLNSGVTIIVLNNTSQNIDELSKEIAFMAHTDVSTTVK